MREIWVGTNTRRLKSRYQLEVPLPSLGEGFRVRAKGVQIYAALYYYFVAKVSLPL